MLAYIRKVSRKTADRGATAVEYGLMVAAIAAIIVGLVFGIGTLVRTAFQDTRDCLTNPTGTNSQGDPCTPPAAP